MSEIYVFGLFLTRATGENPALPPQKLLTALRTAAVVESTAKVDSLVSGQRRARPGLVQAGGRGATVPTTWIILAAGAIHHL